ncbi:MAG: radical SAM protein [Desulfobacteraceae bacterium]|nr:radical SAM protein [Desulfobacteraceae bacterium]
MTLYKKGEDSYTKISYPVRYGVYSEIRTRDAILHFNLNQEIIRAVGRTRQWIHPNEWLKHTRGDDWVYYSNGGYAGVFEATGEYYLPNLQYPTNAIIGGKPFKEPAVKHLTDAWHQTLLEIRESVNGAPSPVGRFLEQACANTPGILVKRARRLFEISGGRVTVMPPDARHVDYDIIPLTISQGCLYKCRFCRIKTDQPFALKTRDEITQQVLALKKLYNKDIANYNSVFLGEHDALAAGGDLIVFAAEQSLEILGLDRSNLGGSNLFLFGSVDSLLNTGPELFDRLNRLFSHTYINIGLESADQETLDKLGKPITVAKVEQAFETIQAINHRYPNIEVTSNFIMDERLPAGHYPSFLRLVREKFSHDKPKGTIYLSPLTIDRPSREMVFEFNRLKVLSRLPTFLYIIQRL